MDGWMDVCVSAQDVEVPAQGKAIVLTDIAVAVPHGTYGRVDACICGHEDIGEECSLI